MANPGGSITQNIKNWSQANSGMQSIDNYYRVELANLMQMVKSGHATEALWLYQTECMPAATQSCEYSMQLQSDALNIANDIRNDITNAQNDFNQILADIQNGNSAAGKAAAQALNQALNQIEQAIHISNITKILGASNIMNISGFIKAIQANATGSRPTHIPYNSYHTGNRSSIVWNTGFSWCNGCAKITTKGGDAHHTHWTSVKTTPHSRVSTVPEGTWTYLNSAYQNATNKGQPLPPAFNTITSAFNQLNQSVSGISTSIQTQMQMLNQNLQQFFGIYSSFFQDYSQLSSFIVNQTQQG